MIGEFLKIQRQAIKDRIKIKTRLKIGALLILEIVIMYLF